MADSKELAESYRDLSKILATIGGSVFVAAGLAATLFSSTLSSSLMLNNTTKNVVQASLDASIASLEFMLFLMGAGTFVCLFSLHFWRKSHKVLTGETRKVSLKAPIAGFVIGLIIILMLTQVYSI